MAILHVTLSHENLNSYSYQVKSSSFSIKLRKSKLKKFFFDLALKLRFENFLGDLEFQNVRVRKTGSHLFAQKFSHTQI